MRRMVRRIDGRKMAHYALRWLWVRVPVFLALVTVYGVYVVFSGHDIKPLDPLDTKIIFVMGVAFTLAATVMFFQNRSWSLKAIGQFLTYAADAQLWLGAGAGRQGWRHELDTTDLQKIRAWFVVAVACLILGIVVYELWLFWQWSRPRRQRFRQWWRWWPKRRIVRAG